MNLRILQLTALALWTMTVLALPCRAGSLDDYYLQQFGEAAGSPLKTVSEPSTEPLHASCGMPLKHDLRRDWNHLEPATQKVLAKQLAVPVLSGFPVAGSEPTVTSSGGHFIIHYTTTGLDAPDISLINQYTVLNLVSITDWAVRVGEVFETAYAAYQNTYGYRPPPSLPYHVYLRSLAASKIYGQTTTLAPVPSAGFPNAYSSYIEIDKDFTNAIYTKLPVQYTPLQSLQITSSHEFHHAIQFGYTVFFDVWYAEATSTWYEGELYPTIRQLYGYVHPWFINSTRRLDLAVDASAVTSGAGYGRWIFNRYLTEQHTTGLVKSIWENLAPLPSPDGTSDIPMLPVINTALGGGLQTDFLAFARRVYRQTDWPLAFDRTSSLLQYVPIATYSIYPVNSASIPKPEVFLEQYSFAYYKFNPSTDTTLNITINGTPAIVARAFRKDAVTQAITEFPFSTVYPASFTIPDANTASEIVLLLINSSDSTTQNANFSTDGSTLATAPVTVTTPTPPATSTTTGGGGGGGGCFIATAAYGSYLHPQVQVLREFRDTRLLTNAPGRAFVALYYRFSPPVAGFITEHAFLRLPVRLLLTPIVLAVAHPAAALLLLAIAIGLAGRAGWKRTTSLHHHNHAV